MPAEEDAEARTAPAAARFGKLEYDAIEADGIVEGHDPLLLVQRICSRSQRPRGTKGRGGIGGGAAEFGVEAGQKALTQIPIRRGQGANPGHPELVDQGDLAACD